MSDAADQARAGDDFAREARSGGRRRRRSHGTTRCSSTSTARCSSSRRRPTACASMPVSRTACRRSRARLGGAVALITGRTLADADRLFPGLRSRSRASTDWSAAAPTVRFTGTFRRCADSRGCMASSPASPRGTRACCSRTKARTLALHYRLAPPLASHRASHAARAAAHARRGGANGGCSRARASSKSGRTAATRVRQSSNSWPRRRLPDGCQYSSATIVLTNSASRW